MGAHEMVPFFINFCPLFFSLLLSTFGEKNVPQWRTIPENLTATVGDSVLILCSFTPLADGDPKPRWHLFNDTVSKGDSVYIPRFELSGNISAGEYHLKINSVTRNDEGPWKCSHILARPQTRTAFLTVKDANGSETASSTMKTIVTTDMKGGESIAHLTTMPNLKIVIFGILFSLAIPFHYLLHPRGVF